MSKYHGFNFVTSVKQPKISFIVHWVAKFGNQSYSVTWRHSDASNFILLRHTKTWNIKTIGTKCYNLIQQLFRTYINYKFQPRLNWIIHLNQNNTSQHIITNYKQHRPETIFQRKRMSQYSIFSHHTTQSLVYTLTPKDSHPIISSKGIRGEYFIGCAADAFISIGWLYRLPVLPSLRVKEVTLS
jgi:hypothetical protein